jgi:hypothetical protein
MIDVEVLVETFSVLREYIGTKDRQAAADHLFSILTDLDGISEKDLKSFAQCDIFKSPARNIFRTTKKLTRMITTTTTIGTTNVVQSGSSGPGCYPRFYCLL